MITTFFSPDQKQEHYAHKSKNGGFLVRSAMDFCKMDILKMSKIDFRRTNLELQFLRDIK